MNPAFDTPEFDKLLEDAIDEGLHAVMAVYCVLDDDGHFSGVATSEGFVRLEEVSRAIRSAFRAFAAEEWTEKV